tara:strand:- start:241 stop:579 length:339 start_codon:yes stop_codon:yes gene_type:complete
MSGHTQDLLQNVEGAPASLTVMAGNFKGAADGRVTLTGRVIKEKDADTIKSLRDMYMEKHPEAFWVDFGDFHWFHMTDIQHIRFIGGFGRAGDIKLDEYAQSAPDAIMVRRV